MPLSVYPIVLLGIFMVFILRMMAAGSGKIQWLTRKDLLIITGSTVLVVGYTAYRTGEMTARSLPRVLRDPAYWVTVFPWALMVAFWLWAFVKLQEFRKIKKDRKNRDA
jgi:hypothetical protein